MSADLIQSGHEALAAALARIQELQAENGALKTENETVTRRLVVTRNILTMISSAASRALAHADAELERINRL